VAEGTGLLRAFGQFRVDPRLSLLVPLYPVDRSLSLPCCPVQSVSVASVPPCLPPNLPPVPGYTFRPRAWSQAARRADWRSRSSAVIAFRSSLES
jgi:hypothetical protein